MEELLKQLGINLPGLIVQIINFVLLLIILRLTIYKYLLGLVDRRAARIKESMDQVEKIQKDTAQTQEQIKHHLDEARQEGQALINQATQIGERLKEEARQEARKEAEVMIQRARAEIRQERNEAIESVRSQFAELTVLAAERIIHKSIDASTHRELIEEVLREKSDLKGSQG